jgi:hypothetical protein
MKFIGFSRHHAGWMEQPIPTVTKQERRKKAALVRRMKEAAKRRASPTPTAERKAG